MTIEISNTESAIYQRERYRRDPEKVKAAHYAWREKNPEKVKEAVKKSIAKDPEYYQKLNCISCKLYYARKTHASAERIHELEIQLALHKESKKNRKGLGPRKLFP